MNLKNASSSYNINWIFTYNHKNRTLWIWKEYVFLAIRLLISWEVISRQIIKQNNKGKVWLYFLYKILSSTYVILIKDLKTGLRALCVALE